MLFVDIPFQIGNTTFCWTRVCLVLFLCRHLVSNRKHDMQVLRVSVEKQEYDLSLESDCEKIPYLDWCETI